MTRNVLIVVFGPLILLSGCASPPQATPPQPVVIRPSAPTAVKTPPAKALRPRQTPPAVASPPRKKITPKPSPDTASLVRSDVVKENGGRTLLITRQPSQSKPVPLFRQAIILAKVRAALTALPVRPQAEFQRGLLTLNFTKGTPTQISGVINRAMQLPEVQRLRANLPP